MMEILNTNQNKNILINNETNFIPNASWEDSVQLYEQNTLKSIINPKLNFETSKFTHEPYLSTNGILQDDIWFYFYFYSDNGITHQGGLNYEYTGLSLDDNAKLTVNTNESFFRLDFYKIPELSGGTLDYLNKKLVFTKNLNIPIGEKLYYTPLHNYIHVPVFMGSNYRNDENMNLYWFSDDSVLSDGSLSGNTFYMTAKYFNSIDGSITNFTKKSLTINDIPNEGTDVYYKVELDKTNKTYHITGSGRYGISNNPIMFYAKTDMYVTPPINLTLNNVSASVISCPSGSVNVSFDTNNYPLKIDVYQSSTFLKSITVINSTNIKIDKLPTGNITLKSFTNNNVEVDLTNINIPSKSLNYSYSVTNPTTYNSYGIITLQSISGGVSNEFKMRKKETTDLVFPEQYLSFTGETYNIGSLYSGSYDIEITDSNCSDNQKTINNITLTSLPIMRGDTYPTCVPSLLTYDDPALDYLIDISYVIGGSVNNQGDWVDYSNNLISTNSNINRLTTYQKNKISGFVPITQAGVVWSTTNQTPTINNSNVVYSTRSENIVGNDDYDLIGKIKYGMNSYGAFDLKIVNSPRFSVKYVRAFVETSLGVVYSPITSVPALISSSSPIIDILSISDVTMTSFDCEFDTRYYGTNATSYIDMGFVLTNGGHMPTSADTMMSFGTTNDMTRVRLGGLTPNTTYRVRAYAINNLNVIGYSDEAIYATTLPYPPILTFLGYSYDDISQTQTYTGQTMDVDNVVSYWFSDVTTEEYDLIGLQYTYNTIEPSGIFTMVEDRRYYGGKRTGLIVAKAQNGDGIGVSTPYVIQ